MFAKKALAAAVSSGPKVYVEDVFSTYLYTGNGNARSITNDIDLSTEGGLVWIKGRNNSSLLHALYDTARGYSKALSTSLTNAQYTATSGEFKSFNTNGFSLDGGGSNFLINTSGNIFTSWTFRKAEKFFDVVTYTGNGSNRTISHNLGSVPGCIIVKRTDTTGDWQVYHRSLANTEYLVLNTTAAKATGATRWNSTTPTSTVFSLGTDATVNANNGTYVAYLFAHDAGGFGDAGTDNVISCGSYTGNGSTTGPTINLGYEPQWVMIKQSSTSGTRWTITDNMRGFPVTSSASQQILQPNTNEAEVGVMYIQPTSTGFKVVDVDGDVNTNGSTYIYIAIRRGPMKTPTSGTSVFSPAYASSSGLFTALSGFVTDMVIYKNKSAIEDNYNTARLTGSNYLIPNSTAAQASTIPYYWDRQSGWAAETSGNFSNYINWMFRRAPGFFDVVCYTGNGPGTQSISHNLGVVPELVINKTRSSVNGWTVFQGSTTSLTGFLRLNANNAAGGDTLTVSSTTFTADSTIGFGMNTSGTTYVTYLFASCPGVSKVGSYTGTGTTLQVNCGFTAGARFVLIKRTDSTGDWYVWDSARGIVAGNDPYLLLNSTAAEVTNTDYIDTYSSGFEISSTAPAAINANGGTFIYLAIA